MLVLSNIFRASHPQKMEINITERDTEKKLLTQNSLRIRQRTKTKDNIHTDEVDDATKSIIEKRLSSSVDTITNDTKSKVICSAKGLLETNLDDLFNDVQKDRWSIESKSKSLGASEPVLSYKENNRGSLVSEDDSEQDTATDSDCLDEVVREQSKCMGAKRIGHLLRRVISRNGG